MHDVLPEDLLVEHLVRESSKSFKNDLNKILEIPSEYYMLAESIIKGTKDQTNTEKWINFGKWLELKEPVSKRDVQQHLRAQWKRFSHVAEVRNSKVLEISKEILEIEHKKSKVKQDKMIVSA